MADPNTMRAAIKRYLAGTRSTKLVSGTGGALNAEVIPSTLVEDYASVSLQVTGTFVGTLSQQVSNDGTNWASLRIQNTADSNSVGGGLAAPGMLRGDLGFRYFRAVITAYTSGTIAASAFFTQQSIAPAPRTAFPAT